MPGWTPPDLPAQWTWRVDLPPWVGRRAELDRLERVWEAVGHGARQLVLVSAEPGAGKSRLVMEVAATLHAQGIPVLVGECTADLGQPFDPLVAPIRELLRAVEAGELRLPDPGHVPAAEAARLMRVLTTGVTSGSRRRSTWRFRLSLRSAPPWPPPPPAVPSSSSWRTSTGPVSRACGPCATSWNGPRTSRCSSWPPTATPRPTPRTPSRRWWTTCSVCRAPTGSASPVSTRARSPPTSRRSVSATRPPSAGPRRCFRAGPEATPSCSATSGATCATAGASSA
jgi:hypothetical protein